MNNSNRKSSTFSWIVLSSMMVLTSCGGSSDENNSISDSSTPPPVTSDKISSGVVQLGPVKGASITIHPFQQNYTDHTLFQTISTEDGSFSVNITKILESLEANSLESEYLLIVSSGGVDTDPDDDGISIEAENKNVSGKVFGLIKRENVSETEKFNINLISSALVDYFLGQDAITDGEIEFFLQGVGFGDQNGDGQVQLSDVRKYDLVIDDSTVESTLRTLYLEYIHSGEDDMRQLAISNISESKKIFRVKTIEKSTSLIQIEIYPKKTDSYISYYYSDSTNLLIDGAINEYIPISISKNKSIYFRECVDASNCSNYEMIFYDGDKLRKGSVEMKSVPDIYMNENNISLSREKYGNAIYNYDNYASLEPEWSANIKVLEAEITTNSKQINKITSELNTVGQGYE
ncbi:hypothetical protein WLQ65_16975 [Pseudoalteromonas piscicida]|uniref:hypothetical protein n=1 Tax=Pseudoalteromonas piscicida TaxID=43662 RepID=UPI0030C985D3